MEQPSSFTKAKHSSSSSSNNSKHPKAKKISISILVISLPVLYVSLLHIPPSTLLKDTTFWFLMSNSIIIIIAADSGIFSSSGETGDLYDEFIKHSRSRTSASLAAELPLEASIKESPEELLPAPSQLDAAVDRSIAVRENSVLHSEKPVNKSVVVKEKSFPHEGRVLDKSVVVYEKPLRQSESKKEDHHRLAGSGRSNLEENKYSKLSDEELNKKVEEFIRRFNREIRLQLRNE